ncbi:MAG: hypothetical protein UX01_C0019G0004 [Candidatus Collierbacteria bacterium GW2011_GWB2_45_17]|uniref:Kazal-like domain-containing protein n=1 Tax=Candidatus Collierbacteria bacterium GW2011_GWB2_45_17 TaxID=1618388 RepID=A0A837IFY3_9BACT|nr:MAG: hypothetical protein UX01_C0019G0004 [Candidatus Collierbacteria bacterium GW2011_GWB2_45_17]HBC44763.1 hypothetical protein [Candidatus Collierbacteria bacterium]
MKNLSGQQSLWVLFPILLVLAVLIAGIILLPTIQTEIRGRAFESIAVPRVTVTPSPNTPEIICSELYAPVCANGITYDNGCEAGLAGVTTYTQGTCRTPEPLPTTN